MLYHCTYQNLCKVGDCVYRSTENPLSIFNKEDLRINSFNCYNVDKKRVLLSSKERFVCSTNLKCDNIDCVLIQNYITKLNIRQITGQVPQKNPTIFCPLLQKRIKLYTFDNQDKQTQAKYISIWN